MREKVSKGLRDATELNKTVMVPWGKESLAGRMERSARLLNIWGMLPDAEYRRVIARIRKRKGIPTANKKEKK